MERPHNIRQLTNRLLSNAPLILHAWAGLANRMLGIASTWELCREMERPLHIVWFQDRFRFHAKFSDLFEQLDSDDVSLREASCFDHVFLAAPRWRKNAKIPYLFQRIRFGRSGVCYWDNGYECARRGVVPKVFPRTNKTVLLFAGCDLHQPVSSAALAARRQTLETVFRPLPDLRAEIDSLVAAFPTGHIVGVHVRRGDHTQAIRHSPIEAFEERMDALLAAQEADAFFLASDDATVCDRLSRRYGPQLRFRCGDASRATLSGIRGAVIDLWTLSRCTRVLASAGSTFGPTAAMLGGIPCETVRGDCP